MYDYIQTPPTKVLKSIYIYILSVCVCPINVKMDEPIGLKFCVGLTMTQENVSGCSELHKAVSKKIDFHKILKIHEKNCKFAKKNYCFSKWKCWKCHEAPWLPRVIAYLSAMTGTRVLISPRRLLSRSRRSFSALFLSSREELKLKYSILFWSTKYTWLWQLINGLKLISEFRIICWIYSS